MNAPSSAKDFEELDFLNCFLTAFAVFWKGEKIRALCSILALFKIANSPRIEARLFPRTRIREITVRLSRDSCSIYKPIDLSRLSLAEPS